MLQFCLKRRHCSLLVDKLMHFSWFQWTVNNNARKCPMEESNVYLHIYFVIIFLVGMPPKYMQSMELVFI